MADRKLMVVNWNEPGDDDDEDSFFESNDRISSVVPVDLAFDDDEDFNDCRMSFASTVSGTPEEFRSFAAMAASTPASEALAQAPASASTPMSFDYDVWMADPCSIKERRERLLQGMGLTSKKDFIRMASRVASTKKQPVLIVRKDPPLAKAIDPKKQEKPSSKRPIAMARSKSVGTLGSFLADAKRRKEQFVASVPRVVQSCSDLASLRDQKLRFRSSSGNLDRKQPGIPGIGSSNDANDSAASGDSGSFFLIKNLDTGKEFIIKDCHEDGLWSMFGDLQTGKQLTIEEFEKCVGYSPIAKELMRREKTPQNGIERKVSAITPLSKSFKSSKKKGAAWLKNIKGVAYSMSGFIGDKDREVSSLGDQQSSKNASSDWLKVRQQGKTWKELTGLYMCQEIQAHQGSIWTIRFSFDARYLASAGEDRIIHVWEVLNFDASSSRDPDEANCEPPQSLEITSSDQPPLGEAQPMPSEKKRRGKTLSTKNSPPECVVMPETSFSLSEEPVCSFNGHLDDVLDLSWSKSQQLLSSSMDKTVRLWDMESKTCLKLFAHNDYVTCIQFNPVDDSYFISGSLDAKVRIWNIPDRQVVDWTDLHEMVTAACYTPDGQGALVGSHKGSFRMYDTSECKLQQKSQIDVQTEKKANAKKITGFQFSPGNPSEVLITSADSRIRIFNGSDAIQKFKGFRNTSSQISASFTKDGKYVVCASEDSQIYVWKREELRNVGSGKGLRLITTRSHEHFHCKDVSAAIPWPGSIKYEPPAIPSQSKRHTKNPIPQPQPPPPPLPSPGPPTLEDGPNSSSSSTSSSSSSSSNSSTSNSSTTTTGNSSSSKRHFPPLPKKKTSSGPDELAKAFSSCSDPGVSGRTSSDFGESSSISASGNSSSSRAWFGSNSNGNTDIQATAWGMVIVTAGLGGEIRAYQNFGLPIRLGRQPSIFKDHT